MITIIPKLIVNINLKEINILLNKKYIFIGFPYKAFGRVEGIVYDRKYYYLYQKVMDSDLNFNLSNDFVELLYNS